MRAHYLTALLTPAVLLLGLAWPATHALAAPARVAICHIPPGNPRNVQTIIVSERAVTTHMEHGDILGACPTGCQLGGSICDDSNLCTDDICNEDGSCSNVDVTASCNDTNDCTQDTCEPAIGCVNTGLVGQACDDGDVCTIQAECTAEGQCEPVQQRPTCCRSDAECVEEPDNLCTANEICDLATGDCISDAVECGQSDACTVNMCVESEGCVTMETNCDDANFCTDDSCDPTAGCISQPTTNPPEILEVTCDDGLDNDCDGFVDQQDPDCADGACSEDTTLIFNDVNYAGSGSLNDKFLAAQDCVVDFLASPDPACSDPGTGALGTCDLIIVGPGTTDCDDCVVDGFNCDLCKLGLLGYAIAEFDCNFDFSDCPAP